MRADFRAERRDLSAPRAARGYAETGRHHEIDLNDPRPVEASKLRTTLRQPVRRR